MALACGVDGAGVGWSLRARKYTVTPDAVAAAATSSAIRAHSLRGMDLPAAAGGALAGRASSGGTAAAAIAT
jgi:hypothetical protein